MSRISAKVIFCGRSMHHDAAGSGAGREAARAEARRQRLLRWGALQYVHPLHLFIAPEIVSPWQAAMKNPNDTVEQSRLWLLQMHGWAQRGLELLAQDEAEEEFDQELAAEAVEALQTVFNLTEPAEIYKMENALLLALVDRVELLLSEGNNNHLN